MSGWQSGVVGWSLGKKGSGSPIELDETLGECHVGVFTVSYQVLLWGLGKDLPDVWLFPQAKPNHRLVPFNPEQWLLLDREELRRVSMGGDIRLRFDQSPVRFGNYILESLKAPESGDEICAFCSEPLQTYFRVGSQPACAACTQKFKQEMRANLARYYRRAVGMGVAASIISSAIHALLIAAAQVSFGSVLIGIFVGMAMRVSSKESAGTRYRVTAAVLTLLAGAAPWFILKPVEFQSGTAILMFALWLAVGIFATWRIASRNVRTEIHGPFQSR